MPVFPKLSLQTLADAFRASVPSILDAKEKVHVRSGREALRLVLDSIDPPPGARVLLPAYHCLSMISPVREAGLVPVFYRLTPDLHPDPDHLAELTTTPACAIVVVHFFGMPTPVSPLRKAAGMAGACIVEDCAHAFYGKVEGRAIGTLGDYAIASSRKFFPVQAGGLAASARLPLHRGGTAPASTGTIEALMRAVSASVDEGGLPLLRPFFRVRQWLRNRVPAEPAADASGPAKPMPDISGPDGDCRPHALSGFERTIIEKTAVSRHVIRRRENFDRYLAAFASHTGCSPVYRTLPPDCAPYLFPLRVECLENVFPYLEDAALPMQRFGQFLDEEAMEQAACTVSKSLSRGTIQLPCHQDLGSEHIDRIVEALYRIIDNTCSENGIPVT